LEHFDFRDYLEVAKDAADISEQVLKPLLSIVKQVISVIEKKGGQ